MELSFTFRPATAADNARIWEIVQQAKAQMHREKRQQWDESYPTPEHIANDIGNGYGYVLCDGEHIIAYGAIAFDGEPTYRTIRGEWLSDLPYVVVHRLAVADEAKGRGVATVFMQEVEKLCSEKGVRSFKVDTNFDNLGMQKILERRGFTYCGEISYQGASRRAYEKLL